MRRSFHHIVDVPPVNLLNVFTISSCQVCIVYVYVDNHNGVIFITLFSKSHSNISYHVCHTILLDGREEVHCQFVSANITWLQLSWNHILFVWFLKANPCQYNQPELGLITHTVIVIFFVRFDRFIQFINSILHSADPDLPIQFVVLYWALLGLLSVQSCCIAARLEFVKS